MEYLIAAYGVTILVLVGYAIQLVRERARLQEAELQSSRQKAVDSG